MRGATRVGVRWVWAVFAMIGVTLPAARAAAQDEASRWGVEGEVGTSLTFGASDQTVVLFNTSAEHESDKVVFGGKVGFEYGEARESEGDAYVHKRSWASALSLDYTPDGRVSPFVALEGEGSMERRIDLRVSGGVGARYRFVRNERGRLDVSLAALVERTEPRVAAGGSDDVETLARWSARLRARRSLREGGVVFDLVSFFKPAFEEPSRDFTVEVTSSLTFALTQRVGLRLSLADRYDSLAEARGARDNHDGRLFFSLSAATR